MRRNYALPLLGVLVVAALIFAYPLALYHSKRTTVFTVTHHERVCSGGTNGSCQYLVYTNEGTFADKDSFWLAKFNSSDIYGTIIDGRTYQAEVVGWRQHFASTYPNVVRLTAVQ